VQILSAASVSGPMVNERFNSVTLAIENDNKTIDWKTFTTDGADITFNGRLYAEQLKRGSDEDYYYPKLGDHYNKDNYDAIDLTKDPMTSAKIRTCLVANTCASGEVVFNGGSGFRFVFKDQLMPDDLEGDLNDYNLYKEVNLNENLYRLDVRANTININSNIMTSEEQIFRSPVEIGGDKINYLVSLDPQVTFLSTIKNSEANNSNNGLVVRAIEIKPVATPGDTSTTAGIGLASDPAALNQARDPFQLGSWNPLAFALSRAQVTNLIEGSFLTIGDIKPLDSNGSNYALGNIGSRTFVGSSVTSLPIVSSAYLAPVVVNDNTPSVIANNNPSISNPDSPISNSNSSFLDKSTNIIKALISAGNNGSIFELFKNLGINRGQNTIFVKSIEVFTGPDAIEQEISPSSAGTSSDNRNFREFNKDSAECSEEKTKADC